ncbi:MAG: hypothetical protein PHC60_07500 [Heliobacteriaceae bacterium]|nr:hypothetical protein [Heliobacteriaceae bacterium]MDD4588214.1 hypothetical protein [Heliobacteriaceae bacterium]
MLLLRRNGNGIDHRRSSDTNHMTDQLTREKNSDLYGWLRRFKTALAGPPVPTPAYELPAYVDLSRGPVTPAELAAWETDYPPFDGLTAAFELLLAALAAHQLTRVCLGINELLKHYLSTLFQAGPPADPEKHTHYYLHPLRQVFEYGRSPGFPFPDSLWAHLSACLTATGLTLVQENQWPALKVLLPEIADLGRQAARDGLPTAHLQHFFRRLEDSCQSQGKEAKSVSRLARNLRFNLEV